MVYGSGATFYTVHRFMIDLLKLSGSKLLIFALIYSFSNDGKSEFRGSREYISMSTGVSLRTVDTVLSELCKKGFIIRSDNHTLHSVYSYSANYDLIESMSRKRSKAEQRERSRRYRKPLAYAPDEKRTEVGKPFNA